MEHEQRPNVEQRPSTQKVVKNAKCSTPGCDGSGNTIKDRKNHRKVKNCPKAQSMQDNRSSSAASNSEIEDNPETTENGIEIDKALVTKNNGLEKKQLISSFNNSLFSFNDSVLKYFEHVIKFLFLNCEKYFIN